MERAAGVALRADGMPQDIDAAVRAAGLSPSSVPSVTVFDSCHDRHDGRHGRAIRGVLRRYMPQVEIREMDERRKQTLCCGAGGAVAGYDPDITKRRVMARGGRSSFDGREHACHHVPHLHVHHRARRTCPQRPSA